MGDRENEPLDQAIDPPDNQNPSDGAKMDSSGDEASAIDPPDNQGGNQ